MERVKRIDCPHCQASLTSARGIRIGGKTTCSRCGTSFIVRTEDARDAVVSGINGGRAALVVLALLLYLGGGAALGVYCFTEQQKELPDAVASAPAQPKVPEPPPEKPLAPIPSLPNKPRTISVADQRQIDKAIADGCWYLREHVLATGGWGDQAGDVGGVAVGFASLPALTLLECGVPASDPVIVNAAEAVRRQVEGDIGLSTYQRSLAILFLDRLGDKKDQALIQRLALSLVAGMNPTEGAWTYVSPRLDSKLTAKLLTTLADPKMHIADFRKLAVNGADAPGDWDNSNSQFAILALWVAKRHQVDIDRPIAIVEQHFRNTQQPRGADPDNNNIDLGGSWKYNGGVNSSRWPAMTCAGLIALAIAHGVDDTARKKQKPLDDAAIKAAIDMLAREIDRPNDPRPPDYYFLWSLERTAVVYDQPKIGGKDWYLWGRKILLARQQADGSWKDGAYWGNNPVLDTCFVLLFLQQANLAKDLTDKLELLAGPPAVTALADPVRKE
jgi:hypothetical protein